jgi:alanine racemase
MSRPIHANIDLAALRHNHAVVRRYAPNSKIWSVVKANAYGHGDLAVVNALAEITDGFALLEVASAIRLRQAGVKQPIVLLEGIFSPDEVPLLAKYDLHTAIHSETQLAMLQRYAPLPALKGFIKFNTGMNRLGFTAEQLPLVSQQLHAIFPTVSLGLMTHFAEADAPNGGAGSVPSQLHAFETMKQQWGDLGHEVDSVSLANSAAILTHPETHADWVRPGIMLYGASPFADHSADDFDLQPVMSLSSEIISVQTLQVGDRVGYGGTFVADKPMRIGTVACGYADGYPRHAPTGTPIAVGGKLTCTIGRVSMDMLACDLTDIPEATIGSPVTLWGQGTAGLVRADAVAAAAGTISYELFCALASRVPVSVE